MSFLFQRLRRAYRIDETTIAEPAQPQLNQQIIDEFLALSRTSDATDISDKLRVFQQCNLTVSDLKPESSTRQEVNSASFPLLCGRLRELEPIELAPKSDTGNSYVRMVDKPHVVTAKYADVFEKLAKESDRVDHPAGLSSLTFAFGSLISLCTSYTDRTDVRYNKAPGFLDLSPLYGLTEDDSKDVRASEKGRGLLLPDAFFEDGERLVFLPRATSILLILFNRNHNYIARHLFEENEHGKWIDPSTIEDDDALEKQDDEIFQLARRINCGMFRNIVANDFLKGLLGFGSYENNVAIDLFSDIKSDEVENHRVSVEFSLLYSWCAMASEEDVTYLENDSDRHFDGIPASEFELDQLEELLDNFTRKADMNKGRRACVGLIRDYESGYFDDTELANVLHSATGSIASAFRARGTSPSMRVHELAAMKQARDWNVCSFNEFRKLLGLPAYKSFAEWCVTAEVANAAQELYGDIDKLELYAGLRGEQALDGAGFCLGKTMTQGLIADIVRLVRSDPNSKDITRENLTNWGYEQLTPNLNNGAFGAYLPTLLLRHLPNNYTYNNVYGLFPFTTPTKCQENLRGIHPFGISYEFGKPVPHRVTTVVNIDTIRVVLGDPTKYPTSYGEDLQRVTGGYGYLLGFDDKNAHDRDEWMTLRALIPDAGALGRFADFYRETADSLIRRNSARVDANTCKIDVIQDVINAASARWVAEILCGIPLNSAMGFTEEALYQMLLDLNNYIFGNVELQDYLALRSKAVEAGKAITECIERNLGQVYFDPESEGVASQASSLFKELFMDNIPAHNGSHDFLAKLAASGRDTKELSANALGLAVLSSVSYAQTCAAAVRFYLDGVRAKERDILRDLAKKGPEANKKIMGYIRESQRLNPQIPVLHREVAFDHILQVIGGEPLELKKGDRLHADFRKAHAEPKDIDPDRETRFLQGSGFHKCVGVPFVEKTMPEVFKAIFRLEDISCQAGKGGLRSLVISYKRPKDSSHVEKGKTSRLSTPFIQRACDYILIILAIAVLYWITIAVGDLFSNIRRNTCASPRHFRPWEVYTMFPGPDNKTAPFIYTVQHSRPRQISFVDIDTRDMQFNVFVDGKLKRVSTDFELDKSIDCGQDADKCVAQGFSKGSVIVPSGKHTVKVEWIGKEFVPGTNLIDWDGDRRRRFMWKQEAC